MQKKLDFKNFRLQSLISRTANETMTLHMVKKEYRIAVVGLWIVIFATIGCILFGAYSYFHNMFSEMLQGVSIAGINIGTAILIFSLITLASVEILTATFSQKMFKFFYRHRFIPAFSSLVVVAFFYTLSFISSTNGFAEWQAKKADDTEVITADFTSDKKQAAAILQSEADRINKSIERIESNPQGWSEGKRSHLTAKQLADIAALQGELKEAKAGYQKATKAIEGKEKEALQKNTHETQKTAKHFYGVMSIIMGLQIAARGLLLFLYYLVRSEESKDAIVSEDLKEITNTVSEHAENTIYSALINASNRIHYAVSDRIQQNKYIDALPVNEKKQQDNNSQPSTEPKPETKPESEKERVTITGFGIENTERKSKNSNAENQQKTAEPSKRFDTSVILKSSYHDFLKKHQKLVVAIKKIKQEPSGHISNQEVKEVQSIAKQAPFKSATTVQKVYAVMANVGFENIDENGNLIK